MNVYGDAMRQLYGTGDGTSPILVTQPSANGVSMTLPGGGGTQPILIAQTPGPSVSHPAMQRPQAIGGYRTAPGHPVAPMAPGTTPPTAGDPRTLMPGQDTTLPPAIGDPRSVLTGNNDGNTGASAPGVMNNLYGGPSASNLYATYLQNQQAGLNSYLTGSR